MKMSVFWNVMRCSLVENYQTFRWNRLSPFFHPYDGGSIFFSNIATSLALYMASYPTK